jgi:cytochrome c biogenesis protein CcmG/thiol:disulfide interchange protein DsbE
MSRGLRLIPIILLLWLVTGFAWRLIKPSDPAIRSQMVERTIPAFDLAPAIATKPGLKSADLADGKPRLLNVFASWCVPCVSEAAVLGELSRRGVTIDAIAVRDTPEAISAFLSRHGDPYQKLGADPRSNTQISLGSSGVPETFVIDGRGTIRYQHIGDIRDGDVAVLLDKLREAGA